MPHSSFRKLLAGLGAALILSTLVISLGAIRPQPHCYLVIHSDDAGFSAAVNEATIRAMEKGIVSSASIMVMCPGFEEIANYAISHPERDFGVHLVLTSEKFDSSWGPVLKEDVPSLCRARGEFWRTCEEVAQHARIEEVGKELRAQIHKALNRKIPVTHLDHHMWVLLQRPDLLKLYVQLGAEFNLPIRLHRFFTAEECGKLLQNPEEYQALIEPALKRRNPAFDFIETNNYDVPPDMKRAYYINVLRNLKPGVSEFVVHCSVNRPGTLLPNAPDRRAADAAVFTSLEIQEEIRRLGIRVIGWKDLVKLKN